MSWHHLFHILHQHSVHLRPTITWSTKDSSFKLCTYAMHNLVFFNLISSVTKYAQSPEYIGPDGPIGIELILKKGHVIVCMHFRNRGYR